MLFVPSHRRRFIESAVRNAADAIILDLEDSVPDGPAKAVAREMITASLEQDDWGRKHIYVRIGALDRDSLLQDLEVALLPGIEGVLVPKVQSADDLASLSVLLSGMERAKAKEPGSTRLIALLESCAGILNAQAIAASSPRLTALAFGSEDYLADLGGRHSANGHSLLHPRSVVAIAARASGLTPVDTVFVRLEDDEGLARHLEESVGLGFDGMLALHPCQLGAIHAAYTPTPQDLARAHRIVDIASQRTHDNGVAISMIDGEFIGPPMIRSAHQTVSSWGGTLEHQESAGSR